ncbi:MAG: hypothetical protein QM775_27745 [Pirellulales bacterium]
MRSSLLKLKDVRRSKWGVDNDNQDIHYNYSVDNKRTVTLLPETNVMARVY